MDSTDIANLSSPKRMATDGCNIGEKMFPRTSKLIKTKVEQDTAYCDLMEKYKTLEAEHERLRQNMSAVTMQNEAITAELQEEQRLRAETLNKEESASVAAAAERELSTRADTIAQMMRELADGANARVRCDSALRATLADLKGATTPRDSIQERVRSLENKLRGKDEWLATQMRIILEAQCEKERLQGGIRKMQSTIDNIHKELPRDTNTTAAAAASAARHQPPLRDGDDNALPAPPPPPTPLTSQATTQMPCFLTPLILKFVDESDDSSLETDHVVDPVKVMARLETLARGSTTPVPLRPDDTVKDNSQEERPRLQNRFFKTKRRRDNTALMDVAKK